MTELHWSSSLVSQPCVTAEPGPGSHPLPHPTAKPGLALEPGNGATS